MQPQCSSVDTLKKLSSAIRIELLLMFAIVAFVFALLEPLLFPHEDLSDKIKRFYNEAFAR